MELQGKGTDGLAGLKAALDPSTISVGLLRVEAEELKARGAKTEVERYAFIQWVPVGVSPMLRGACNSHRGVIRELFNPFQIEVNCETQAELVEEDVFKQLEATCSGQ